MRIELRNIDCVVYYTDSKRIVIFGSPEEDDERHNCDYMGCRTMDHVLFDGVLDYCKFEWNDLVERREDE